MFRPTLRWQDFTLRKWAKYSTSNESGEHDPQDTKAVLKPQESLAQVDHINVPQDQTPISPLSLYCYPSSMFAQALYHQSGYHCYSGVLIVAILGCLWDKAHQPSLEMRHIYKKTERNRDQRRLVRRALFYLRNLYFSPRVSSAKLSGDAYWCGHLSNRVHANIFSEIKQGPKESIDLFG